MTGRVIVGIPAFNEETTVGSVVAIAKRLCDEVVVVDDGSRDDTAAIAETVGARVLRHERNQGKGAAIRTLFQSARAAGASALVLVDADGQHDPREITKVLAPVANGEADVSIGIRFGANTQMPLWRRVGKRTLDLGTASAGGRLTDSQSGFRAYSRTALERLNPTESGFGVESQLLLQAREQGLRLAEVPITCDYGTLKGSTKGPLGHGLEVLAALVRAVGERHPLLMLGVPALALFLLGVLLGARVIDIVQRYGEVAIGTAVLASLFMLGGLMLGLASVMLHVLPGAIARQLDRLERQFPAHRRG